MSQTPPLTTSRIDGSRDRTPELTSKREKRHREDDENDRDRSGRSHRHHEDEDRERRHRHRHREDETEEERKERKRRHHHEDETEEEREDRRRRRKEREARDREPEVRERSRHESRDRSLGHHRDRSKESHRSHRSRDTEATALRDKSREEKEAEREKRDREMFEERREAARQRDERFAEMDRERERERRMRDRPPPPPPPPRRASPTYEAPPPPREPPPPRDPVNQLLDEVDSESRSVFVSQLAARLTSSDLGLFFEDKLGRGAVRDARVVSDRVSRRSKGIGYVELDAVELVNRALALSGTVVMGIPMNIQLTESERNRQGQVASAMTGSFTGSAPRPAVTYGSSFPPLSTGLAIPPGVDTDAHRDASIPYHRLFVTSLAVNLSADDLRQVFEPFGGVDFVDLHMDFSGQSKGTAYVQFKDLRSAQMALDAMNGFDLAGRPIRVYTIQERAYVAEQIEETGYGTRLDNVQRQQLMFKLARTEPNVNLALSAPKSNVQSKSPAMHPTDFVVVSNMFNPEEETERNWDLDLAEDVKGEVEGKYGRIKRIKVDKMSAGEVYIEFDGEGPAGRAIQGLNGRFFGGRQLQASFISEALFKAHL